MKVAILAGGRASEREASLSSGDVIREALRAAGHEIATVTIERSGAWHCDGSRLVVSPGDGLLGCDVVFPALHGPVQGLLEALDVPYVGAGVVASSLCMDGAAFRDAMTAAGGPQMRYLVVREPRWRSSRGAVEADVADLGMPVLVKPARLGGGSVKVDDPRRLQDALETAFSHDGVAVLEECSNGIEVECAVIGHSDPETSVPRQKFGAPVRLSPLVAEEVRSLARETFLRVGCSGLARIEFFVEPDRVLVNAIDTVPRFTLTSSFPRLWAASGLGLPELCDQLLGFALERFRIERPGHRFELAQPVSRPMSRATSARDETPSLRKMFDTWFSTVRSLT